MKIGKKVHAAYAKLKNCTAKLYTIEEVDEILEKQFLNVKISFTEDFLFALHKQVGYSQK